VTLVTTLLLAGAAFVGHTRLRPSRPHVHACIVGAGDSPQLRNAIDVAMVKSASVHADFTWFWLSNVTHEVVRLPMLPHGTREGTRTAMGHTTVMDEADAMARLDKLLLLGERDVAASDELLSLWLQQPAPGAVLAAPCKPPGGGSSTGATGGPLLVHVAEWRAMRTAPDASPPVPQHPASLGRQMDTWRARRQMSIERDQSQQLGDARLPAEDVSRYGAALVADLPPLLAVSRITPTAVDCLPATTSSPQPPTSVGGISRRLLSISFSDMSDSNVDDLEELEGDDEPDADIGQHLGGVSEELKQPPRQFTLPPPVPSAYFSGLPPALPPLPSPLDSLLRERQRLESKLHALPPPLPPPVLLGAQCSPSTASSCASVCDGGTCECDLYPDYSESAHGLRDDRPHGNTQLAEREHLHQGVKPPARHTLFFNSDFKGSSSLPATSRAASPPDTAPRHHRTARHLRRRLAEDKMTGPALHLLCHCACPSASPL